MRLPNLLNQLKDAVFLIDPESDSIADANPEACALLGYSREELISIGVFAVHPDDIQEFQKFTQLVRAGGGGWTDGLRCLTKSGGVLAIEIYASIISIYGEIGTVVIVRAVADGHPDARKIEVERQRNVAIVEERNQLASEIHDTLVQPLTLMVLRLEMADDAMDGDQTVARAELESIRLLAASCVEEARRSIWDLQPQVLDSSGLVEAVEIEVERLRQNNIEGDLRVTGAEPIALCHRNKSAALRVVQEALNNVINYSQAKTAVVSIYFDLEELRITVADDGVGFEHRATQGISPTGGGFGLTNMRERARLTGGLMQVQSTLGQGTTVEARIPYESTEPGVTGAN